MGIDLYVSTSDKAQSITVSRFFLREVINGLSGPHERCDFRGVLSQEEHQCILPNELGEVIVATKRASPRAWIRMLRLMLRNVQATSFEDPFEHMFEYSDRIEDRERDPVALRAVIMKLREHIRRYPEKFPLWHRIYRTQRDLERDQPMDEVIFEDEDVHVSASGTVCYCDEYPDVRNKVLVHTKRKNEPAGDIKRVFVPVAPTMVIHGVQVFTRSLTMEEMCRYDFDLIMGFLDVAIENDRKVLWEYW
ncbi:MAG: hypothetical protein R3301_19020 [Saprospiraceae bacterium]|nr:hypothetical protein [Saprospiraceae bacterium]